AGIDVNGTMLATNHFGKQNILTRKEVILTLDQLLRGKDNIIKIGKDGTGKLFYDMLMSYYYTSDTQPPADQGMSILQELGPVEQGAASVKTVKVGETYRMTLTDAAPCSTGPSSCRID